MSDKNVPDKEQNTQKVDETTAKTPIKKDIVPDEVQNQESPQTPVAEDAATQQVQILSRQDTLVSDLVKEQPDAEEVARIASARDRSGAPNILELPEECYPLHGVKYRYRWLAKDERLEARLRSSIWMLCTRSNSPYMKPYRFKSHGAVEQAGMLLAFAPEDVAKGREEEPAKKSAQLVKHYTEDIHKQGSKEAGGYYKPEEAGEDDTGDDGLVMD